jgi:hypothetical protein
MDTHSDEHAGEPDDYDDELYPPIERIDFGRIYHTCRELCLFDDVYLGMQAINIAIVDPYITEWERDLLQHYIEIERTPLDRCMFVSAQSQMWIFAVYELLRTWRGRIKKLIKWSQTGGLKPFIEKHQNRSDINAAASIRVSQARRLLDDPTYRTVMESHYALMETPFQIADSLRVNLAKHEIPGNENQIPIAPGYGRINMLCGAMDFQIHLRNGDFTVLNRRDLAEALRAVELPKAASESGT